MIVVDASALLEVLLRTPAADAVEDRLFAPGQTLHAPHLLDVEAAQVILGHAMADVTELYAAKDLALAKRVAAEVG